MTLWRGFPPSGANYYFRRRSSIELTVRQRSGAARMAFARTSALNGLYVV
jgi:hypothetical protein